MKKLFAIIISITLMLSLLSVGASAETLNITSEITYLRNYYVSTFEKDGASKSFDENIALAVGGAYSYVQIEPYYADGESVSAFSTNIITNAAFGKEQTQETVDALVKMQNDDGSFGNLDETLLAVVALKTTSTVFGSESAVNYILSNQQENGSFGDSSTTARVLSVINMYSTDSVVATAIENAVNYLKSDLSDDGVFDGGSSAALSYAIMGLCDVGETPSSDDWGNLFAALVDFKTEDGSYKMFADDEEPSDEATALAMCALHALGTMHSPLKQLMTDGSFVTFNISDYTPFFIAYGVLAALSIAFWVFIFVRKKNNKTLAETKKY